VYGHLDDPETSGLERGVTYLKLRPGALLARRWRAAAGASSLTAYAWRALFGVPAAPHARTPCRGAATDRVAMQDATAQMAVLQARARV
jgi:hypothetical protein